MKYACGTYVIFGAHVKQGEVARGKATVVRATSVAVVQDLRSTREKQKKRTLS